MKRPALYRPKRFDLSGLNGISDRTIEMHLKLYEGYVTATNGLNEKIFDSFETGDVDAENMPAYSELKRRLGFEYNGMVLHEYYFGSLKRDGGDPAAASPFFQRAQGQFGNFAAWKRDFIGIGKMRGVGWAVCYEDPGSGRLSNHWISSHDGGHIAGYRPLLVMDLWEHAFLLDYKPSEKESYIEAFFLNVDWQNVEKRLRFSERRGFASALCTQRGTATTTRRTHNEGNILNGDHGDGGRRTGDQHVAVRLRNG